MVRTLRCGRSNPGSNPGHGMPEHFADGSQSIWPKLLLRRPGIEPGSTAWKAAILTTRLIIQRLRVLHGFLALNLRWGSGVDVIVGGSLEDVSLYQSITC